MFDDLVQVVAEDHAALTGLLSAEAPGSSAEAFAALPGLLADGDDTPAAIHARIDLALLSAREGLVESALYQVDELTKDARRVRHLSGNEEIVERADACRAAIETAAQHAGPA